MTVQLYNYYKNYHEQLVEYLMVERDAHTRQELDALAGEVRRIASLLVSLQGL